MSSVAVSPAANAAVRTVVHKFGGTSVADAERYRHVAQLLLARDETVQVTVVSAMKGVTDALIGLAKAQKAGDAVPATLVFKSGARLKIEFAVGMGPAGATTTGATSMDHMNH